MFSVHLFSYLECESIADGIVSTADVFNCGCASLVTSTRIEDMARVRRSQHKWTGVGRHRVEFHMSAGRQ